MSAPTNARLGARETEVICSYCGWRERVEAEDAMAAAREASTRVIERRRARHAFAPMWATRGASRSVQGVAA